MGIAQDCKLHLNPGFLMHCDTCLETGRDASGHRITICHRLVDSVSATYHKPWDHGSLCWSVVG